MKIKITLLAYAFGILAALANSANSPEFKILRLGTEESAALSPGSRSGGGIAISAEKIFMTDGGATHIYDRNSFEKTSQSNTLLTSLCSDFLSGKVFVLLDSNNNQIGSGGGAIAKLAEVNSSGEILQSRINLSQAITISGYTGIFSGYGRIVIYTGGRVYDISLPEGQVLDLGAKTIPLNRPNYEWAAWGVAEFFGGELHLTYARSGSSWRWIIERMRVSDQFTENIVDYSGSNVPQVNSFSVWPDASSWFFSSNYYYNYTWTTMMGFRSAEFSATRVLVKSAQMRPGTTLMDVVYRVVDHERPTAKVRALAFKDGVRSFANIIRPTTFVEGTGSKIGDSVATNQDHTLTWDVAADWNVDLGQVKFEVLALDPNGLLPFKGITIPAANGKPELKINQTGLTDSHVLNALFWMYADGHTDMGVANGNLIGSASSGVFKDKEVVRGSALNPIYAHQFLFKLMNISAAGADTLKYAEEATRTTKFPRDKWLTASWAYEGSQFVYTWGQNGPSSNPIPEGLVDVAQMSVGENHCLALKKDGTVVAWAPSAVRYIYQPPTAVPADLKDVAQIASGKDHCLALKNNGRVVAWGNSHLQNFFELESVPNVKSISAGDRNSLLITNQGYSVFGNHEAYFRNVPIVTGNIIASAVAETSTLLLFESGMVSGAGGLHNSWRLSPNANILAVAAGKYHGIALRANGTVATFGDGLAVTNTPQNLSGIIAIASGFEHCLALKSDGTVIAWGSNSHGQCNIPADLKNVVGIAAGGNTSAAFTVKAP